MKDCLFGVSPVNYSDSDSDSEKELEKIQNRAARFVTRNYDYETGSMTGILGQLKWESLKKRRKDKTHIVIQRSER